MENSVNENEAHQSLRSPPRRRRSTFFERRDSIVPQFLSENVDTNACKKTDTNDKVTEELTRYYEKLLLEKEQWKKEVKSRRHRYDDLKEQCEMAAKSSNKSISMSLAALSKEDIEFLNGKPNLSKLIDSQQKLHKSVKETCALYSRANDLDDIILNDCERKINTITEHILENSTVEPVETKSPVELNLSN
ncbi:uncharacterized protein LOC106129352 [Amyelois transitella]|uniref:uncharacterized protein LOC106129352 n=1 Tax=Amyelois transitella TaxID=680683 RepID=UPI00067CCCE3|nr:uncharacterized protein LOC106129352 [Amyelois transitella]